MPTKLTYAGLKKYREQTLADQGFRCGMTGYPLTPEQAVVDHDHQTGHIRGVIHRGVNALLGKIENNHKRYGVSLPLLYAMLEETERYLERDHTGNPIYPSHKSEDEKRLIRNAKARAKRATSKKE